MNCNGYPGKKCCLALQIKIEQLRLRVDHLRAFVAGLFPELDYESVNAPVVMTPWEMREHISFILGEAQPHPQLSVVHQVLVRLSRRWHALWSCYGEAEAGWPRYRALLDEAAAELRVQAAGMPLKNGMGFNQAISSCVIDVALESRRPQAKATQ